MHSWRSFNVMVIALLFGGPSVLIATLAVIDPYGTGRFTPIQRTDIVTDDNNYFGNATRLRDPRFNAAIIGNSRSMRLAPYRLNELTSLSFVMLAMPALDPHTQITVADAFVRNHPNEGLTIVWGLGDEWCRTHHDPIPFPRWLYEPSSFHYLRHLLASSSIGAAIRRVLFMAGFGRRKGTIDGYEQNHPFWNRTTDPAALLATIPPSEGEPVEADLPLVSKLAEFAHTLNSRIRLVLVFQPIFEKYMPVHGSKADQRLSRCKSELERIGGSTFIDAQKHSQLASRPESFIDVVHFKDDVAVEVEIAISAQALSK